MKYCTKCGKELMDEAVICTNCGCPTSDKKANEINDAPNGGLAVLGFFIPLVGLILYLVYMDTAPLRAKSAGKGALIGFIVGIVFVVLYFIFIGIIMGAILSGEMYYSLML